MLGESDGPRPDLPEYEQWTAICEAVKVLLVTSDVRIVVAGARQFRNRVTHHGYTLCLSFIHLECWLRLKVQGIKRGISQHE